MNGFHRDISWPSSPAPLVLAKNEVHLLVAPLNVASADLEAFAATLSETEKVRAAKFRFDQHRCRFVAGRGLLRAVLGQYLQTDPRQLNFVDCPRGKPRLDPEGPGVLHFNLAHAEDLVIFAVTRLGEVGVDLECVRRIEEAHDLVARFFSKGENATFQGLPEAARAVAFFNLWTRKEALLKATGEGLGAALNAVEVSFLPGETARLVAIAGDTRCASEWSLEEFSPAAGYVGAAAVRSQKMRLRCWKWNQEGV